MALPPSLWKAIRRDYRRTWGVTPRRVRRDGVGVDPAQDGLGLLPGVVQARRRAIEESLRWGEPYVFLVADGVVSWAVALVEGELPRGGLCGAEVLVEEQPPDVDALLGLPTHWDAAARVETAKALAALPRWPRERVWAAAQDLAELFYARSGWQPLRWWRNRADAEQQRQIAEAIHTGKRGGLRTWPLAEERQLLQLIRAGDLRGARGRLNALLGAMFLDSPRLPILQARALELLGYLVRVAVEDAPECAVLMAAHHAWMVRIIGTTDFEILCRTVRDALEDFMAQVASQGLTAPARHVRRALDHLEHELPRVPTLDEAARAAGISRFRLAHLLKALTGKTYGRHVAQARIERACRRLRDTAQDCAGLAAELGFADQSHFTRVFRAVTGTTPAAYRRAERSGG